MRELLEQRARIFEQARGIIDKAQAEKRALTSDEQVSYDKHQADVEGLTQTITRARQVEAQAAELSKGFGPVADDKRVSTVTDSDRTNAAIRSWIRSGYGSIAANEEFRGLLPRAAEYAGNGDAISLRVASPLAEGTNSAGGYTVPTDFYRTLIDAMKWFGGVRQAGPTLINSANGQNLPIPSANDTGNTGELVAENQAATQASTEMSFGQVTLHGYKFSSKYVKIPLELIQDSAFDIENFVAKKLGERLGRAQNTYFTTGLGSGSSQPQGIITGSTSAFTAGSAGAITYAELQKLIHSVDPAYRPGAKFMMSDGVAQYLEGLTDSGGRPILTSVLNGWQGEVKAGDANAPGAYRLLGYPTVINNDMASSVATTNKTLLFGDMSTYYVRQVLDVTLIRFQELFMQNGQIALLAWWRGDGACVDAGTHPLQFITQP
jgi:HK97 family phage major capsid protein